MHHIYLILKFLKNHCFKLKDRLKIEGHQLAMLNRGFPYLLSTLKVFSMFLVEIAED